MKKDSDERTYEEYLNGNEEAYDNLYKKYINKITFFIFNIVKNYQIAEELAQETFIYIFEHKLRKNYSFKYYIYLVARSKAYDYLKTEKRRNEIKDKYLNNKEELTEKDVLELIIQEESKNRILLALDGIDEKYRNAIYLTQIERLSYKETSKILGESLSNTKTLVHRGKKLLHSNLEKEDVGNMNKFTKTLMIILLIVVSITGITYAAYKIYQKNNTNYNITFNPTYESTLDQNTVNNLWVGTLDLAWKELEKQLGKDRIDLEDGNLPIVDELNNSKFSKDMLNEDSYKIDVSRTATNGYKIDTTLNKELNFLEKFDNFNDDYKIVFGDGIEYIKYFGINNASSEKMNQNVEVLFYNKENSTNQKSSDFAIKLKTKEGDEIILYRTNDDKSFDEYYSDIQSKSSKYEGSTEFGKDDMLLIPYVRVNGMIAYNELYGKFIKDTNGLYFADIVQNVNFYLSESGCNLNSTATMVTEYLSASDSKYCYFTDKFIIFMKEANAEMPYFALKVDNEDILEKIEENNEPKIIDYTAIDDNSAYTEYTTGGEYKFYEDENYEYYYPSQKTKVVQVFFKDGEIMTVEEALKQGKITIDLLDKYGVEYIKRNK